MHRKWWNLIRIRTIETGAEPGGGEPPQPEPPQSDQQANTGGEGDEKLGEHGMTALKNERRANKSLREQLAAANASMPARYRLRAFICGRMSGRPAASSSAPSSIASASGSPCA